MNPNDDYVKKMFEQARELQDKITQAIGESDKFRDSLLEQARKSADVTHEQTKAALDNLEAAMKTGSEFLTRFMRDQKIP
jgi:ABC-type transporter Mla subunit MlaD